MPAPQISPLPNPPSRSQSPETFSVDADAFLGALPDFQSEANDQADYLDALAIDVDEASAAAVAAASIAAGAANYQGDYSAGTTYQIGESVSYTGRRYVAKTVNTGVTPADGANWFLINDGDVLGPVSATANGLAFFDGATGKIIKSGLGNGTLGQVLVAGGTGAIPSWSTPSGSPLNIVDRTSNTMLAASDLGKLFRLTGNFTQTFDAAATLGAGWWCYLENMANLTVGGGLKQISSAGFQATFPNYNTFNKFLMSPDGLSFIYTQTTTSNTIYFATLTRPFDFTTAGSASAKNIGNIGTAGNALAFGNDGTKFYVSSGATIYQYSLSTPYNVSTATYDGSSYNAPITAVSINFNSDGTQCFINNSSSFRTLTLSTAWAINTATSSAAQGSFASSDTFDISPDGLTVIAGGNAGIIEYSLPTAYAFASATIGKRTRPVNNTAIKALFASNGNLVAVFKPSSDLICQYLGAPVPYKTFKAPDTFDVNDIILDPNGSETIDERSNMYLYPGEMRLIVSDGVNLKSLPLRGFTRHFSSSSDFNLPSGYDFLEVMAWGGGGGGNGVVGGLNRAGAGGGGAGCVMDTINTKNMPNTIQVTIGAGATFNSTGASGGTSSFAQYVVSSGALSATNSFSGVGRGWGGKENITLVTQLAAFGDSQASPSYATSPTSGGSGIYSGGSGGGTAQTTSSSFYVGGNSYFGAGGGGAGAWNNTTAGQGGSRRAISEYGGAAGTSNFPNGDANVPFGCGGGGGAWTNSIAGNGADGGLGGGGGGGSATDGSTVVGDGGNGGNGFVIVRGII